MKKKLKYQVSNINNIEEKNKIYSPIEEAIRTKNKDKISEILKKDPTQALKSSTDSYISLIYFQEFKILELILDNVPDDIKINILNYDNALLLRVMIHSSMYYINDFYNFIEKYHSFIQWNVPHLNYVTEDQPEVLTLLELYILSNCIYNDCSYKLIDIIYKYYKKPFENYSLISTILLKCYINNIPVNKKLIKYLVEEKNEDINGGYGLLPNILMAALLNDMELLEMFKKYKADFKNTLSYKSNIIISYLKRLDRNDKLAQKNDDIILFLIDNGVDVNTYDYNLFTLAHYVFSRASFFSEKIKRYILEKTNDLTIQNVNGDTILHYIVNNDNWEIYQDILEKKPMDIFVRNKLNFSVLKIIKEINKNKNDYENIINKFLLMIAKSYKYISKSKDELEIIIKKILKKKNSVPKEFEYNDIRITEYSYADHNIFSSLLTSITIHYFSILSNYDELGIPYYPDSNPDIFKNMTTNFQNQYFNGYFNESFDGKFVLTNFKELQNFKIFWCDENNYLIPPDLDKAINYTFDLGKKYIVIFISIQNEYLAHANILLIDNYKKKIYHFEPHGLQTFYIGKLYETLNDYFKKVLPNYEYLKPTKFLPINGYQTLSDESNIFTKKIGDQSGYCAAWCEWFVELYLQNKNYPIDKLVSKSIKKLINYKYSILEHIRNYANHIQKLSNQVINNFNIPNQFINLDVSEITLTYIILKKIAENIREIYEVEI